MEIIEMRSLGRVARCLRITEAFCSIGEVAVELDVVILGLEKRKGVGYLSSCAERKAN